MLSVSPKLGEFLVKATKAKDIDDAFHRVFSEYLVMKIASLAKTTEALKRLSSYYHRRGQQYDSDQWSKFLPCREASTVLPVFF